MSEQPISFGALQLATRYLLSPLAGYTNLPFRLAVRELGGLGLATTDLVNARALLSRSAKTLELIATDPTDKPLAVQIYGGEAGYMAEAAQWLQEYGVDAVDINMGCPVKKVTRKGGGSAMMCNATNTIQLVQKIVEAVTIPITVKMRLGWDDTDLSAPAFAREFEQVGVAAVIIHGRTREQGFSGNVNLAGIRAVVDAVDSMPIVGNGDIRTIADAEIMFSETGCSAISIGRGALLNPWIFLQLCRWERTGEAGAMPTYEMRLDFMERHFHLLAGIRPERFACLTFRKVAGWYSKSLKPGRELHNRMMELSSVAEFDEILATLRERGVPPNWSADRPPQIAVPSGPISHW